MNEENSVIVIDQQEQHKKKGALAVILAIAFVAILGIGGTFAYLTYSTNQTVNRFTTVPANLTADLLEPAWSNAIDTSATNKKYASDGTTQIPVNAAEMVAGSEVAKNPFVVNTSYVGDGKQKASDAYCAIKLTFQKWSQTSSDAEGSWADMTADDLTKLMAVYSLQGNDPADADAKTGYNVNKTWTNFSNAAYDAEADTGADAANVKYYYYTGKLIAMWEGENSTNKPIAESKTSTTWGYTLGSGPASTSLFDKIVYNKDATNDQISALNTVLKEFNPGWRVTVKAAVVQATDQVQPSSLTKEFKNLLDNGTNPTSATGWRDSNKGKTTLGIPDTSTD